MKHRAPFLGVESPARPRCSEPLFRQSQDTGIAEVLDLATRLRAQPEREFPHVAGDLLARNAQRLRSTDLGIMRVTADALWDSVDALASPTIGVMVQNHSDVADAMDGWIEDDDMWIVRVAILHNSGSRNEPTPT